MAYCSKCGSELIDSAIYCSKCGTRSKSDLSNSSNLSMETKVGVYAFKKNWTSAWVIIGSMLSPFRELQIISAALGFYLVSREVEKYDDQRKVSSLDTSDVDKYMTIQFGIGAIHIIYLIVAFYYFLIENGFAFWL